MNWLLLRGLSREKNYWLDFPEKLQASSSVIQMIDLPGVGEENWTRPPLTIASHTEFLRKIFLKRKTNNQKPYGIIGISLGGMIAMDWAARHPDDFSKLVVINSSAQDLSSLPQRISPFAMYCMSRAAIAKNVKDKEYTLLKMVSNLKAKNADTLKNMVELSILANVKPSHVSRQLIAAAQFKSPEKISIPSLVLSSIKDRMVDVRCSKSIAEKYQSHIKFHPTAGHDIPLDDPDWVVEQIAEFSQISEPL